MSKLSWRTKLMGLFILILGASLLFQLFYVLPTIRSREVEMAEAHQEETVHNIAWQLDNDLMGMKNTLVEIAGRAEFRNMDIANQQQTMTQIAEFSPDINSLYVMDAEGWFVAGTAEDLSPYQKKSYTDKPYYIAAVEQGQTYFAAPRVYFDNTIVSVSVSVPIESDTGERVGLLVGTVWLNPLIEKLKNYPLDEEMTLFLVDREGTVVAHSEIDLFALEEGPLSLDYSDRPMVQTIIAGDIYVGGEYEHEGVSYFGHHAILESNGWGVIAEVPMAAILARSEALAGWLLLVNAVLFVIALAVSLVFTRQITAERQRAEKKLKKYSENLEEMVKERTHHINERIKELQCLYGTAESIRTRSSLEEVFQDVAKLLPPSWHYPDITRGKIVFDGNNYVSEPFKETEWKQSSDIIVNGDLRGSIEVYFLEKYPELDEGPFMKEERNLINSLARSLSLTIESKQAEEELARHRDHLEELVEERTKKLRETQEQLARSEKLAVLGQLAGGVGHELRNPLGSIKNAAYFLKMALEKPEPEVKETLEILNKEVATSEHIISALLDFARPKPPTRHKVEINHLLQEALSRTKVPEKIKVVSKLDKSLPQILADPEQLGQVFRNLILNAIQAMPDGGQLEIRSEVSPPAQLAISFADTGVGIPEDNLEKLFEPLFTTRAKGIGLGLAITKTLVEGHKGTIEVQSKLGKGSIFTVRLPLEEKEGD